MKRRLPALAAFMIILFCAPLFSETLIKVLIYSHDGASKTDYIARALESCNRLDMVPGYRFDVALRHYTPDDRLDDQELMGFDVLLVSGGWVDTFHPNWNRDDVRSFVAGGGGYVGICAGEILAIEGVVDDPFFGHYEGLEIAPHVKRVQPEWVGSRNIRLTQDGTEQLGIAGDVRVLHWNGSILTYESDPPQGRYVMATFEGNRADRENPDHGRDIWDTHWDGGGAIVGDFFGEGRVLLSSPHPEHPRAGAKYQNPRLVGNMVRWAFDDSRAQAVVLGRDVILPQSRAAVGLQALSASVTADLSIEEVSVYVRRGQADGILGVYQDEDGYPGALLGTTATVPLRPEGGWFSVDLETPVSVNAGDVVWLAWHFDGEVSIAFEPPLYDGDIGNTVLVSAPSPWIGGLPAQFPPEGATLGILVSARAAAIRR